MPPANARKRLPRRETAAQVRARYAPFVAEVRKEAVRILNAENVPGGLRLFQRRTAMRGPDGRWSRDFLGKYSHGSFGWTGTPNISINPALIHAECESHNRDADPVLDDPLDPKTVAVDTVLHEYAHAIWDLLRDEAPRIHRIAAKRFDEEDFAEELMAHLRGHSPGNDEFFLRLLPLYRRTYAKGLPQDAPHRPEAADVRRP